MADFRTQYGESFVGEGPNAAHLNTVLGSRGGPVETAWVTALATPRQGHIPFVTLLRPGVPVKPFTLFVNKAFIAGDEHATMTWGPAQAGVAKGVAMALADGVIERSQVDEVVIVAAVWVDPKARDRDAVYANNTQATLQSLRAGKQRLPAVDDVLAAAQRPFNAFFPG